MNQIVFNLLFLLYTYVYIWLCIQDINLDNTGHDIEWIGSHSVPHSLLLHVRRFKISGFDGENKQEMVKYLLKNGDL